MRTTIKPRTTKSVSTLTKEMDSVFSEYIRLRDADANGTVECFVTGEKVFYRDADAAHFHPRQHMATRWNEMNVHATTQDTNRYQADHYDQYEKMMYVRYSLDELNELHWSSKSAMKWTSAELIEKIEEYKLKVAQLKREKGL